MADELIEPETLEEAAAFVADSIDTRLALTAAFNIEFMRDALGRFSHVLRNNMNRRVPRFIQEERAALETAGNHIGGWANERIKAMLAEETK